MTDFSWKTLFSRVSTEHNWNNSGVLSHHNAARNYGPHRQRTASSNTVKQCQSQPKGPYNIRPCSYNGQQSIFPQPSAGTYRPTCSAIFTLNPNKPQGFEISLVLGHLITRNDASGTGECLHMTNWYLSIPPLQIHASPYLCSSNTTSSKSPQLSQQQDHLMAHQSHHLTPQLATSNSTCIIPFWQQSQKHHDPWCTTTSSNNFDLPSKHEPLFGVIRNYAPPINWTMSSTCITLFTLSAMPQFTEVATVALPGSLPCHQHL